MLLIKYSWPICNWTFYILFIDVLDQNSVLGWHQICYAYDCVRHTHLSPGNVDHCFGFFPLYYYLMCTVLDRCVLPKKLYSRLHSLVYVDWNLCGFFFLICELIEFFHLKSLKVILRQEMIYCYVNDCMACFFLKQSSLILSFEILFNLT